MSDQKRGDDVANHIPKPHDPNTSPETSRDDKASDKQDAANYADRVDGGRAAPTESINSANDA